MRLKNSGTAPQNQLNSKFRIICIDDDKGIIVALKLFLEREGYEVWGFTDFHEGVESIRNNEYDLLILDYLLDGANGDYVVRCIREFNRELYILLLTGHSQSVPALSTLENNNIQGYCIKSDDPSQLLLWVKSAYKSIQMANEMKSTRDNLNKVLKEKVAEQTKEIKLLLDNTGEGFLYFSKDLIIKEQYSLECTRIFNEDLANIPIYDLIYPYDEGDNVFLRKLLLSIFNEEDPQKQNVYLSLLPDELKINGRYINLKFKMIDTSPDSNINDKLMMVILADITEKRELQSKIQANILHLEMVVGAVSNYDMLTECLKNYTDFSQNKIYDLIDSYKSPDDILLEILRLIHTFKGNFSQVKMINTSSNLHELESKIDSMVDEGNLNTIEKMTNFFRNVNMPGIPDKDMEILKSILGNDYFNKSEYISIDIRKLKEIKEMIKSLVPNDVSNVLINQLEHLMHKSLKSILKAYSSYTYELALKEGKDIYPFEITGDDVFIDCECFRSFYNSLTHIFRNIIAHGIETKDERIEKGKDAIGTVSCTLKNYDTGFELIISDDGAGIDPSNIRSRCTKLGNFDATKIAGLTDDEIIYYIFEPGFSTSQSVNELYGRGLGLVSVKKELERLGGKLKLQSSPGIGTSFSFKFNFCKYEGELTNG